MHSFEKYCYPQEVRHVLGTADSMVTFLSKVKTPASMEITLDKMAIDTLENR
jgi:hypothetical protein